MIKRIFGISLVAIASSCMFCINPVMAESFTDSTPRPYQKTVIKHAQHMNQASFTSFKGCLVWHTMGTGKTLTGLNILKNAVDENNKRALEKNRGGGTDKPTWLKN